MIRPVTTNCQPQRRYFKPTAIRFLESQPPAIACNSGSNVTLFFMPQASLDRSLKVRPILYEADARSVKLTRLFP